MSPESFLNFLLKLYIPPWLRKSFKFIVLRLLENTFVSQKIESVHFYSCSQAKLCPRFLSSTPGRRKLPIPPEQRFLQISFFPQQKGVGWAGGRIWGGEDYGVEKITKIKPTRVLVTSFDKFHHLCNLYIFGFCFVVP